MLTLHTSYRSGSLDLEYRAHQSDLTVCEVTPQAALVQESRAAINLPRLPANCAYLTLYVHAPSTIPLAADSLHLKITSVRTVVCEFTDVALDTHVDWFCLGVFVRISDRWAFKEVLAFPDHRAEVDSQLVDLLHSIKDEISDINALDDSYTFLAFDPPVSRPVESPPVPAPAYLRPRAPSPPAAPLLPRSVPPPPLRVAVERAVARPPSPLQVAVPGSVVRSVKTAAKSGVTSSFASPRSPPYAPSHPRALPRTMAVPQHDAEAVTSGLHDSGVATDSLGQVDFFAHHNREVRTLQGQVERLEGELLKYRARERFGPLARGKSKHCEKCATSEAEVAMFKERLVELEANAVLSELMGGSGKAEFLIVQEENRTLRLKNAELEGKCSVQTRMIDELKNVKKQLVDSITRIPKSTRSFVSEISENFGPDEDPVVHHIRVQERLIAGLKEQLDILATQLTIGQALIGDQAHDDEL